MHRRIKRLIIAANKYIEDPFERDEFKEKIYKYLEENEPEVLYRLMLGN